MMRGGARLALQVHQAIEGTAFVSRRYDSETVSFIVGHLPDRGVFFDVGANVGMITFMVQMQRNTARIIAFEASPANVQQWIRNRALNAPADATIVQAAVADRVGTARFLVEAHESTFGRLSDEGNIEVPMTSLDAYCSGQDIEKVHVLKMDIEGGEAAALAGAQGLLGAGAIDVIVAEAHLDRAQELDGLLRPHGYVRSQVPSRGLRRLRNKPKLEIAWTGPSRFAASA
jgi:FkbM family methyltransferase